MSVLELFSPDRGAELWLRARHDVCATVCVSLPVFVCVCASTGLRDMLLKVSHGGKQRKAKGGKRGG